MRKKLLGILIVMILTSSVLFAGGGSSSSSSDPNTFSLLVDANQAPGPGCYGLYDVIERETGIKVDLRVYPYQAAVEQKNILLSTGDYPDAMGGWIISANDIMTLSADKIIIPLENLIMNTTNVRAALEVPGIRASMTLPDGHIYSPPYLVEEPLVSFLPWINENWLNQLGLRMPSTTEEFKQVLIAFRDRIPNVSGQRIIPFSGSPNNFDIGALAGWWGVNAAGSGSGSGVNAGGFAVINGRVESTITRNEFREVVKFFADLYRERLIDPELFTQDEDTWKAKGKLGLYGSAFGYGPGDWIPEIDPRDKESDPSRNWGGWAPLPVLRAPGVTTPVFRNNNYGNSLFRNQFVITDKPTSAKAANIMKWLDACYSPQHSLEQNWGPMIGTAAIPQKGLNPRGTWSILSQNGNNVVYQGIDNSSWTEDERQKNGWAGWSVASLPRYQRPRGVWTEQPRPGWENEHRDKDIADALYRPFLEVTPMPALWHDAEDGRRVADLQTAIGEYMRQKVAEWVSGQANIDTEWDTYLAQLNRLGLQELLTLKRNAAAASLR